MNQHEIQLGRQLAPGETIVWHGRPSIRGIARDVFHLRAIAGYFAVLMAANLFQAWMKQIPLGQTVHDSVPLLAIAVVALAILGAFAWATARHTRYVVTDRRVVLHFGVALPATLSLPYSQIVAAGVSVRRDHSGDVVLDLKDGNRMPYLKLWPLARAWRVSKPQPMLRAVPRAAVVGGLLVRAIQVAEQERLAARPALAPVPSQPAKVPVTAAPPLGTVAPIGQPAFLSA